VAAAIGVASALSYLFVIRPSPITTAELRGAAVSGSIASAS